MEFKAASGSSRLGVGLATALVWALAAGSALYWGLHASRPAAPDLPPVAGASGTAVDTQAVAHALGVPLAEHGTHDGAQPAIASRVHLSGVITHGAGGAALLSVDGNPPKPYRVGAQVDGGWVVHAVTPHAVELADGPQRANIDMPPLSERSNAGNAVAPGQLAGMPAGASAPGVPLPPPVAAPISAPPRMLQNR